MSTDKPISECDPSRVDNFLNAIDYGLNDEVLVQHLDYCLDCRSYIEQEAADVETWQRLQKHLVPTEFDVAGSRDYSSAACAGGVRAADANDVLDALAPTDNPHNLGRLGGYEVTGVVGAGGMGVVLKAVDHSLDRVVAIKVMSPRLANSGTARKRFLREAKAAAAVLHPNVIPIHGVDGNNDLPHLVMSYVRGGSLQKRIEQEGPLSTVEILRIGSQIAAGLAAAHDQGLVHRDVKPENILLECGIERVTLTDFGLARTVDDVALTREGGIVGTPQYMSPEQARGESIDEKSDLFSLGSVLYTLCTGRPPFRGENIYGVMKRISDEDPTPIHELNPEIPDWLCCVIEKLMAKQAKQRFATAAEVQQLFEACIGHVQQPTAVNLPPQVQKLVSAKVKERIESGSGRSRFATFTAFAVSLFVLLFASVVYYIQTNKGTVRIEVLDESLSVTIKGQTVTMQDGDMEPMTFRPGEQKLVVKQGDIELITEIFQLRRGDKLAFRAELLKGKVKLSEQGKTLRSQNLPDKQQEDIFRPTSVPGLRRLELPSPAVDLSTNEKTALIVDEFGVDNIPMGLPRIWSLETNEELAKLPALQGYYLRLVPGDRPLCLAGDHRRQQIRFWDLNKSAWHGDWIEHDLRAGSKPIFWPIFSPDGKIMSIANLNGALQFWRLDAEEPVKIQPPADKPLPRSNADKPFYERQFSVDGKYCFAIFDAKLYVLDPTTATTIAGPFPHRTAQHLEISWPSVLYHPVSETLVTIESSDEIRPATLRFRSARKNWEPVHSTEVTGKVGTVSFLGPYHVLSGGLGVRKTKSGFRTAQNISTIIPIKPGESPHQILERDAITYVHSPDGKQWVAMSSSSLYTGQLDVEETRWRQPLPQVFRDNHYVEYELSLSNPDWVVSRRTKSEQIAVAAYSVKDGRLLLDKSQRKYVVHVKSTLALDKEVFRYTPNSSTNSSAATQSAPAR